MLEEETTQKCFKLIQRYDKFKQIKNGVFVNVEVRQIFPIATFTKTLNNKIVETLKEKLMCKLFKIVGQKSIKIIVTFLKFFKHFTIELAQANRH